MHSVICWERRGSIEYALLGKWVVGRVYKSNQLPEGQPIDVNVTGDVVPLPGVKKKPSIGFHMDFTTAKQKIEQRVEDWLRGALGENAIASN